MRKIATVILLSISMFTDAQSNQVVNAFNALRNKEYAKGKSAADAASLNESTRSSAKLWLYRGKIYQAIYESKVDGENKLDNEAQEKAVESYVNCFKLDKENAYKDELTSYLVSSCAALFFKANNFYLNNKDFNKTLYCYDILESAIPFDYKQGLKLNNITQEKLLYSRYRTYALAADKEKTKELADKLIEIKYKDPFIYTDMVKISLIDKDTTKALEYIDKGRLLYNDNMDLINSEINIYLAQKKMDFLKKKLADAIALTPNNEVLHAVLANVYEKSNDNESAEKEYLKALEIKPNYDVANYNLGVLYFNTGNQWNEKLNALPLTETKKTKEYEDKKIEYFKKATVNLEKSYEVSPDKATKQRLRQLFLKLGETEKAEKYK